MYTFIYIFVSADVSAVVSSYWEIYLFSFTMVRELSFSLRPNSPYNVAQSLTLFGEDENIYNMPGS